MKAEEWIDKYYLNELTIEELEEFKKLLKTDDELKDKFEFQNDLSLSIKSHEKDILKVKLQQHEQAREVTKESGWKTWLVAASILILIGVSGISYFNFSSPDYDKLYAKNYEAYPNTEFNITRGENNPSLEYNAFMAYESGDYKQAIPLFSELRETNSSEYLDFYLAQSYLANDNYEEALSLFEEIIQNQDAFAGESHWFAALAALRLNKKTTVQKYLSYLVANSGYRSGQAEELIKKLD